MFGGLAQCVVLVPSDLVKCRLQIQQVNSNSNDINNRKFQNGPLRCAYNILKAEGIGGLYSGFLVTALREVPSYGIYFCVYKKVVSFFKDPLTNETSKSGILLAGGLAGCASWTCVYPCDVVKTNIQLYTSNNNSKVPTPIEMAKILFRKHGLKVFVRGLEVTLLRAFPVNACTFYVYENLLRNFK
jgi:solute carrier family 25 carnitine/acylcarnitine transporter 20/29